MIRSVVPVVMALLLAASCSRPALETRTAGITAIADKTQVTVRLDDNVMTALKPGGAGDHTITVEAFDARGNPLGGASTTLPGKLRYACVPLTPAMKRASRLVVTAKAQSTPPKTPSDPGSDPGPDPGPDPGKSN